ncbi:MAG: hypothetical protein K2Q22_17325, partial [Cytophagales bacterium]|nr:hypothetical protein [Cytophagales bacterium]
MVCRYFSVLFFFICFQGFSEAVRVDGKLDRVSLVGKVLYFEDTTHKMTLADVQERGFSKNFKVLDSESIPYGKHPIWFTFTVDNQSDKAFVLNLGLVGTLYIDLYKFNPQGKLKVVNTGIMRPFESKEEKINFFIFNLDDTQTFIGRVETWDLSFIPIQIVLKSIKQKEANLYGV